MTQPEVVSIVLYLGLFSFPRSYLFLYSENSQTYTLLSSLSLSSEFQNAYYVSSPGVPQNFKIQTFHTQPVKNSNNRTATTDLAVPLRLMVSFSRFKLKTPDLSPSVPIPFFLNISSVRPLLFRPTVTAFRSSLSQSS